MAMMRVVMTTTTSLDETSRLQLVAACLAVPCGTVWCSHFCVAVDRPRLKCVCGSQQTNNKTRWFPNDSWRRRCLGWVVRVHSVYWPGGGLGLSTRHKAKAQHPRRLLACLPTVVQRHTLPTTTTVLAQRRPDEFGEASPVS